MVEESSNSLGAFLRARRGVVDPGTVRLPDHRERRVPGLRREEVAFLSGVSPHYYARLEQGRNRNPSPAVLDALARALQLDEVMTAHLHVLAEAPPVGRRRVPEPETIRPELKRMVEAWTEQPAAVIGRHRDVLAANELATLLNEGFTPGRNLMRDIFLDPVARDLYRDRDTVARGVVASVRATADADDPRLIELVGELSARSEEFREIWARHDVHVRTDGLKHYNNPFVGEIAVNYHSFAVIGSPGQTLYLFSADPGSPAERSLRQLAGMTRHRDGENRPPHEEER
ncbi:helix-turn-helix transcriptional regulator [Saccharopolyspora flava]|uniref:helix-turn-helix transcriptional regulator n=1 Tax=Saccharopolyspora flava TaxID=95161 RepID=UPI000B81EFAC|nr:helix-turn-helix transcriptional regulator [Saccharopolyspora flava]